MMHEGLLRSSEIVHVLEQRGGSKDALRSMRARLSLGRRLLAGPSIGTQT